MSETDAAVERAWEALEEESAERALELARELPDGDPATWILRATAELDLGRHGAAEAACARAAELGDERDPGVEWVRGELALAAWDLERAGACFERLRGLDDEPASLERLALVRDLEGRFDEADALLREAERCDAELHPFPPRLDEAGLDRAIEAATADLPEEFQRLLEEVPVVVEPVPSLELARADGDDLPPDLLGLFVGASRLDRSDEDPIGDTPRIYLFQRNLERACAEPGELVEQLRVTLYHELGHLLGFDEEGVDDLGLG